MEAMKRKPFFGFLVGVCFAAVLLFSCAGAPKTSAVTGKDDSKTKTGSIDSGAVGSSGSASASDSVKAPAEPPREEAPKTAAVKAEAPKKEKSDAKASGAPKPEMEFITERADPTFSKAPPAAASAPAGGSGGAAGTRDRKPSESGLKAGWADDNAQYNLFLDFLKKNSDEWPFRKVPAEGRLQVRVLDAAGDGVPNARLSIKDSTGKIQETLRTYADGTAILTPEAETKGLTLEAESEAGKATIALDPAGPRSIELTVQGKRRLPAPVPLDIVFVLDTTGSMGEEIERLKETIDIIRDNLDLASPRPLLRFGLVLYRDRGDQYVTEAFRLTDDQAVFRRHLSTASAGGGGDDPEDLEAALQAALGADMGWDETGIRLAFVITDAPAQAYPDAVGYDAAAEKARAAAIKIHTIGTGGLPLAGEYQLRQIAQRTRGRYIFLTYGERGESEGGASGAVSHHSGSNWNADRLETIIIRFAKEELALMGTEKIRTPDDDYFEAKASGDKPSGEILDELFSETVRRLVDYSSAEVTAETPAAVLPVAAMGTAANADAGLIDVALKKNAEYFGMRFLQAASTSKRFRIVERSDLQAVLAEWELRLSSLGDGQNAAKLGELLGAEVLLAPSLVRVSSAGDGEWELSVRLIRVGTGEILSISRARIAGKLGL